MSEDSTNKEANIVGKSDAALRAVMPLTPFLSVREDGGAEIVFMSSDGRIVGKDEKYNEEFAKIIEAQILRAKIAGAGSPEGLGRPK